jgi:hypothetical protein
MNKIALSLAALLWAGDALAQPVQPVSYIAEFHVQPGKETEFLDLVQKVQGPALEKLMAERIVLAWGADVPILHEPGAPNVSLWWSAPDMAAMGKALAALQANTQKMEQEEAKAAKAAGRKPRGVVERFLALTEPGKHRDWLFRDLVVGFSRTPPPPGLQPYTWINTFRIVPGKGQEFREWWEKNTKPVYDKLLTEGAIGAYGFAVEEVRTTHNFSHFVWVGLPDLGAREKVRAAFRDLSQARTPEDRRRIAEELRAFQEGPGRSLLLRSVVFHVAPPAAQ